MKLENKINIVIGEGNASIQISCDMVEFSKYKVLSLYEKNYFIGDIDLTYGKLVYSQIYKNTKIYYYMSLDKYYIHQQIKKLEKREVK